MLVVGGLITAAVTARFEPGTSSRSSAALAVAGTIVAIGLGEWLAANDDTEADWLDASRLLAVFGLLLGGCALAVIAGSPARDRGRSASWRRSRPCSC